MGSASHSQGGSPQDVKARLEAERAGVPFLVLRDGSGAQRIVALEADRVSIGRRDEADVSLDWDGQVSRLHALLERVGGEWTVVDDGLSQNGTFVGGERVTGRRRLHDRDAVLVGQTLLTFRAPDTAAVRTVLGGDLGGPVRLSDAQRRVLVALARPCLGGGSFATPATNGAIAEELFLSVDAVKTHLRTLFGKFELGPLPQNRKRAALVEAAVRAGVISERDAQG